MEDLKPTTNQNLTAHQFELKNNAPIKVFEYFHNQTLYINYYTKSGLKILVVFPDGEGYEYILNGKI